MPLPSSNSPSRQHEAHRNAGSAAPVVVETARDAGAVPPQPARAVEAPIQHVNPLWAINVGLAVFAAVAIALMATG